ncbi:hypothetical protein B7463_g4191, partial [Scytalidium lignicola]
MEVARVPIASQPSWAAPATKMRTDMQMNGTSPTSGRSIPPLSELMHRASMSPNLGGNSFRSGEKSYSEPATPALLNSPSQSDQARFTRIPLSQLMASTSESNRHGDSQHAMQPSPSASTASVSASSPRPSSGFHVNGIVQQTLPPTSSPTPPVLSARSASGTFPSMVRSPRPQPLPIREIHELRSVSVGPSSSNPYQPTENQLARAARTFPSQSHQTSPIEMQREGHEESYSTTNGQAPMPATSNDVEAEIRRLTELVNETSPQALHAVLRKNWRPFIFQQATDDHTSFILRAGLQNASAKVMERVVRDKSFPSQNILPFMPQKQSVIDMCLSSATSKMIKENVPADVLDEVCYSRLATMPAQKLVTMLATASRLGYSLDDIVDEDDYVIPAPIKQPSRQFANTQTSNVQPHLPLPSVASTPIPPIIQRSSQPLATSGAHLPVVQERDPMAQYQQKQYHNSSLPPQNAPQRELTTNTLEIRQNAPAPLICANCKLKLPSLSGYNYHLSKNICEKGMPHDAKWSCHNCLKFFTTKQGQTYHQMKRVCYGLDIEPATAPSEHEVSAVQLPPPVPSQPSAAASFSPQPVNTGHLPRVDITRYPMVTGPEISSRPAGMQSVSMQSAVQSRKSPTSTPPPSNNRVYPSELPPEQLNELNAEIEAIQRQFEKAVANIPATLTPQERDQKLTSLKNSYNTRKSVARKKHGVSLRKRIEPTYRVTPPPKNELLQSFRALPPLSSAPPRSASYAAPSATQSTPSFNAINQNPPSSASRSTVPEIRPDWGLEMNSPGQRLSQSIKRTMESSPESPTGMRPATVQRTESVTRPSMMLNGTTQGEKSKFIDLTADSSSNEFDRSTGKEKDSSSDDEDIPAIPLRRMSDGSAIHSQPMVVINSSPRRHESYPSTFVRASSVGSQNTTPRRREKGKQYAVRGGRRGLFGDRSSQRPSSSGSLS